MNSPIESARAKLRWAHVHMQTFDLELRRWQQELFAKRDLVRIKLKPNPEAGKNAWIGIIQYIPTAPHRFALISGDIVHSLRGALDHIAWVLAELNDPGRTRDTQTQFPIVTDPAKWGEHPVTRWTKFMSTDDVSILERLQPYNATDTPEDHPLAWLEALSNRDKHREIHAIAAAPDFLIVNFRPIRDCVITNQSSISGALEVGAPALWVTFQPTGPHPQVQVDSAFTPTIAITEGRQNGLAKYVLPNMKRAVARVVRIFEQVLRRRT